MRILYVSQYYPPEIGAPSARVAELSRIWAAQGQNVSVLTGFPNHPDGKVPREYRRKLLRLWMRDDRDGVKVYRTWLLPFANRKSWERMLNYASFFISATLRGLTMPKPDVLIATSPQLLVGLAGLLIASFHRVPFIFEVRDLWPESLEAVGVSHRGSLLYRVIERIAALLYRHAACIVVVTPPLKQHLVREWKIAPERVHVVLNGIDEEHMQPGVEHGDVVREFGLQGRFVVSYVGTLGNAHGAATLLRCAKQVQESHPTVFFLIVGSGAERDQLRRQVAEMKLRNVLLAPPQPRSRVPAILAASHACVVLLRRSELFRGAIPTKMLEMMACGRPVILSAEGESAELLSRARAGITVPPEDASALAAAVRQLHADPSREKFGQRGTAFARRELTRSRTAMQYIDLLRTLLGGPNEAATIETESIEDSTAA